MADPVTFTASAIANLAFQEFLQTSAGELAKKFSAAAIAKMGELRQMIWNRLQGKNATAEIALSQAEKGYEGSIEIVSTFLSVEMLDDEFAEQVRAIAQEIHAGKLLDQSSMVQNNSDNATGYQVKNEGGENYMGNITIHKT
ncbi:hypothetical protein [Leptolyngbya sp. BC1307]|uniref:hypothetical protein n=1 Tax=Leptolyngbya sp. BC1307 TaxID=2029589 RepID=UPI000EFD1B1C|nr:hypothetical protein [Leptolyngbya sp. BC1307]